MSSFGESQHNLRGSVVPTYLTIPSWISEQAQQLWSEVVKTAYIQQTSYWIPSELGLQIWELAKLYNLQQEGRAWILENLVIDDSNVFQWLFQVKLSSLGVSKQYVSMFKYKVHKYIIANVDTLSDQIFSTEKLEFMEIMEALVEKDIDRAIWYLQSYYKQENLWQLLVCLRDFYESSHNSRGPKKFYVTPNGTTTLPQVYFNGGFIKIRRKEHDYTFRYVLMSDENMSLVVNGALHVFPGAHNMLVEKHVLELKNAKLHQTVFRRLPSITPTLLGVKTCEFGGFIQSRTSSERVNLVLQFLSENLKNFNALYSSDFANLSYEELFQILEHPRAQYSEAVMLMAKQILSQLKEEVSETIAARPHLLDRFFPQFYSN